jgi:hypothetical protein
MFNVALQASRDLGDEDTPWPGGWKEQVLRTMLPLMRPDMEVDDALRWVREQEDAEGAILVHQLAHTAVARQLKTNANAKRAVAVLEEESQ